MKAHGGNPILSHHSTKSTCSLQRPSCSLPEWPSDLLERLIPVSTIFKYDHRMSLSKMPLWGSNETAFIGCLPVEPMAFFCSLRVFRSLWVFCSLIWRKIGKVLKPLPSCQWWLRSGQGWAGCEGASSTSMAESFTLPASRFPYGLCLSLLLSMSRCCCSCCYLFASGLK